METEPVTAETEQKPESNFTNTFDSETDERTDGEEQTKTSEEYPVSLDNIFEILKNQRRRLVLRYLFKMNEPVSMSDLAEFIASEENGKPTSHLSSQERKRVYVGLYQCHLPKMDDMGVIKFNKNRGIIELGPAAEHTKTYLQDDGSSRTKWPMYYLSIVGVGWIMLLGSLTISLMTPTIAGGVFLTLLTACALINMHSSLTTPDGPTFNSPDAEDV